MEIFERIVGIILPVFIIIALGYGYARLRGASVHADMAAVSRVSMDVLSPLLIFTALAGKDFDLAQNGILILIGAIISLGSGLLAWPIARFFNYDARTFLPPMIYNNCGNMGLPLSVLAFGASSLGSAVALFMACNLIYFSIGIKILESGHAGANRPRKAHWQFLHNPMMIAMLLGIIFAAFKLTIPAPLFTALQMLGSACIPVMLFLLGIRMCDISLKSWPIGILGACVCPLAGLAVAWLLDQMLALTQGQRGQMYLFASLPPAIFCFMMAERFKQELEKVASIVLLGNLSALIFVPLGLWLGLPK